MRNWAWRRLLVVSCTIGLLCFVYWRLAVPEHRVAVRSELVMLGDLDADHQWTPEDLRILDRLTVDPFSATASLAWRSDLNQNGLIDPEDVSLLRALVAAGGDPYAAEETAHANGTPFPRPRELYRYVRVDEYRPRPIFALPYARAKDSVLDWLDLSGTPGGGQSYQDTLSRAVHDEAVRFDQAWRKRAEGLLPIERRYATSRLARAEALHDAGDQYALLLALMDLVEDAETLTVRNQPDITLKILALRDHLREALGSPLYADFQAGKVDWRAVLRPIAEHLKADVGLSYDFETLGPPRNLTHLENYLDRAEWQYYKASTREEEFLALIDYAQHDPRYLRAVSRTSRKLTDIPLENHNLPMVLLFREALRIKGNDKKKAIGLLDEAIRIPYGWIKSIPREMLPGSLAFDNFLLPGNKEDGADKSRHWNVFGGICIYKSAPESIDLAVKREMQDLRDAHYSAEGMREFFRDLIGDLNGMYHVMVVNPELLAN
jgi:hypothetical protein